jgi:hypothetical protein
MLYGRLLDKNTHGCNPLADLSYPVVLLQGCESRGDRFIESLRGNLYGVLNISNILYRNRARSEDHESKRSIFAFYSLMGDSLSVFGTKKIAVPRAVPQLESARRHLNKLTTL